MECSTCLDKEVCLIAFCLTGKQLDAEHRCIYHRDENGCFINNLKKKWSEVIAEERKSLRE